MASPPLIAALACLVVLYSRREPGAPEYRNWVDVPSCRLIATTSWPGRVAGGADVTVLHPAGMRRPPAYPADGS